jgi:hypothetical protein
MPGAIWISDNPLWVPPTPVKPGQKDYEFELTPI